MESVFHGVAGSVQRARRMAVHEALLNSGALVGAVGGGFFYERNGMPAVFIGFAVMLLATAAVQAALLAPLRRARLTAARR